MKVALCLLLAVLGSSSGYPQRQQQQPLPLGDYDYLYDDLIATPDFQQPVPQAPIVLARPRTRQEAEARQPVSAARPRAPTSPQRAPAPSPSRAASARDGQDGPTTTPIPIVKDSRRVDPVTGAFIYDYMGADGSGKYEVRYPNGTVVGNFTYINDQGERETRWYSAGNRGLEIAGDSVISPAPPTLVDETTGPNYVDLSNYDLYRHLEEPYVHIEGPSDPDERGQLSSPGRERAPDDRRATFQQQPQPRRQQPQSQQQAPAPARVPLDFGDDPRFAQQEAQIAAQQQAEIAAARAGQRPSRVSRTRVRVVDQGAGAAPAPGRPHIQAQFDPRAVDGTSPNAVLDSIIRQFQ